MKTKKHLKRPTLFQPKVRTVIGAVAITSLALFCGDDGKKSTLPTTTGESGAIASSTVALNIQGTRPGSLAARLGQSRVAADGSVDLAVIDLDGVTIGTINLTEALIGLSEIQLKLGKYTGGDDDNEDEAGEDGDDKTSAKIRSADDEDGEDVEDVTEGEEIEEGESVEDHFNSDPEKLKFKGPYIVNLLTNTTTPVMDQLAIPVGVYDGIKMKLDKIEADDMNPETGAPLAADGDPMFEKSMWLNGTYTATGGSPIPFSVSLEFDEEFELTPTGATATGMELDPAATLNQLVIAFRLGKWLDFLNSEKAQEKGKNITDAINDYGAGDEIRITKDSEPFAEVIKENVKASADYGRDKDGNGKLEDDEDDDEDTEDSNDD